MNRKLVLVFAGGLLVGLGLALPGFWWRALLAAVGVVTVLSLTPVVDWIADGAPISLRRRH